MLAKWFKGWDSYATLPLRLVLGIGLLVHGFLKFTATQGISAFGGWLGNLGVPIPAAFGVLVGLIELVGGAFILFGFLTRYSAALASLVMIGAVLLVHIKNGGYELPLVYLAGLIALMFTGGGSLSVDKALNWDF